MIPAGRAGQRRNDMYVTDEALRLMAKSKKPAFSAAENGGAGELQEEAGRRDQVHSDLGEGGGGTRAWAWAP